MFFFFYAEMKYKKNLWGRTRVCVCCTCGVSGGHDGGSSKEGTALKKEEGNKILEER